MANPLFIGCCAIATAAILLLFLRQILLVVDRVFPGRTILLSIESMRIGGKTFAAGGRIWPLAEEGEFPLKLMLDGKGRLVVGYAGQSFTLGPVRKIWDELAQPEYLFGPEEGDEVRFTRDVSRLCWLTPFHFSILGGATHSRKRHLYHRLVWRKASGSILEMTWRDEQSFYRRGVGWSDDYNDKLRSVRIRPGAIEKVGGEMVSQ
jgi:hypothetical protein